MSLHERDGHIQIRLDPRVIAVLTAWVDRDEAALREGWQDLEVRELVISMFHLWECAIDAGEELGGPTKREVLAGMGISLARITEEGWG